jgi:hypothetical protein
MEAGMTLLRSHGVGRIALLVAVVGCMLAGLVTSAASASDASIKAVIKSYDSKILVAEGHLVTAIGEYKEKGNPAGVQKAIRTTTSVLLSLKSKIASQSASSPRVKLGKAKFVKGLQRVVVAYRHLGKAFGEKKVSPQAAKMEARKAVRIVKGARLELREGAKLLS